MIKIGIAGMGAVGLTVAKALYQNEIDGCKLAGFSARTAEQAAHFSSMFSALPSYSFVELANHSDMVLESLPPNLFMDIAQPVLSTGKTLIVLSASQLLGHNDLLVLAKKTGAKIIIPSGAMLGFDALKAAAVGKLKSVTIKTSKPIASLQNAPYISNHGIDLSRFTKPTLILAGSVLEVAKEFPANVNVAAALSFAGMGPEKTRMEVWVDPSLKLNKHKVTVISDSSDFTMSIQNRPSAKNPATGKITAQSVIALLKQINSTLQVGS